MFQTQYSAQYQTVVVIVPAGAKAAAVIEFAREVDALAFEGGDEVFVVQLPDRPAECYSEDALRRSLRPKYALDTITPGVKVSFKTDDEVPDGLVEAVGMNNPPIAGVALSCAPIRIGGKVFEGLAVRTWSE